MEDLPPAPAPPPDARAKTFGRLAASVQIRPGASPFDESSGYEDFSDVHGNSGSGTFDQDTEEAPGLDEDYPQAEERLAVFDFEPEDVDQMGLTAGEKILVEEIDGGGEWILATNLVSGNRGWVPLSFTAPM